MKRLILSVSLVLLATISGVAMSFSPSTATALGSNSYVSLGDSVAAGLGLNPIANANAEDKACGRSSAAYPNYVASALSLPLQQLACSGAKANHGLYDTQDVNGTDLRPQIDQAFAAGTPDLITITIGANDARWSQFVQSCYVWSCGTNADDLLSSAYILHLRWELYVALEDIQTKSGNNLPPPVVFTGYFTPFSENNPICDDARNFNPSEITWLNTQVATLDQTISDSVSHYAFASYVPLNFSGHELCSNDPWVQSLSDAAPFHPTAEGQRSIARSVVAAIRASTH